MAEGSKGFLIPWTCLKDCEISLANTVYDKCSHRLTQSSLTSKPDGGSPYFLVVFSLSLGGRQWLR